MTTQTSVVRAVRGPAPTVKDQGEETSAMPAKKNEARRMLAMKDVVRIVRKHRNTVWRWIREKKFPRPHRLPSGQPMWFEDEVTEWQGSDETE